MDESMNDKYISKGILRTDENGYITYKVVDRTTGETYSLMAFNHIFDPSEREQIHLEFQTLKQLDHANLVRCHDLWGLADGKIHLVLDYIGCEYIQGTNLSIRDDESQLAHVAHQLLLSLDYLHSKQIWHGSVENSNIFIDLSTSQLKVLYLGRTLSRVPFVVDDLNGYDNFYLDVWNLGLSIFKFYMGAGCNDSKLDVHFKFESASVEPMDVPRSHSPATRKRSIDCNKEEAAVVDLPTDDLHSSAKSTNPNPIISLQKALVGASSDTPHSTRSYKRRSMDSTMKQAAFVDLPVPVLKSSKDLWNFLRCCMQTDVSSRWNTTRLLKHPFISDASSRKKRLHASPTTSENIFGTSLSADIPLESFLSAYIPRESSSSMDLSYMPLMDFNASPTLTNISGQWSISDFLSEYDGNIPVKRPKLSMEYYTKDITLDAYNKCIQHCLLFPQDYEFGMDKVVQLWIAEGCINEEERMEDVAKSYFEDLVIEEFIIPKKLDIVYGKMVYKLNISKFSNWSQEKGRDGDYLTVREVDMDKILRATAARHLSFDCTSFDPKIFDALKDFKQLRTLLLLGHSGCRVNLLPHTIFLGLKLLRSLDLSLSSISELPSAIGNLESLRCLDVSETPIRQLPESTDCLSFLQTLRLRGCVGVHSLPKKLEKLINLRHLDMDIVRQLKSMPRGMRSLIKLQTLHAFLVGNNDRCGIDELQNLNNITGSFCISGLENVSSLDEAKQAMLANKKHLDTLELRWSDQINENSLMDAEILERLQPHFGIKELKILCYKGSKLPSWISNPSFVNLANITLYKCLNCHILPSIGELPSLKSLTIGEMNGLRDIDSIFCRNHGNLGSGAFRSLEKLTLDNMLSLEKWTGLESGDFLCLRHFAIRYCPKLSVLPVLSHLWSLLHFEVSHCSQLISLPEGGMPGSLESLIVRDCPNISEEIIKEGLDRCKIAHVANIWIDFKKFSLD